jgi:hypothetical protein
MSVFLTNLHGSLNFTNALVSEHLSHSQIFLLLFVSSLGPVLMLFGFAVIGEDNKPVVVKRRTKSTNLADDERTTRRESYLKATEGGRMHFDSEMSDGDVSPQVLRSGSVSGNSSSSASLDREKANASPLDKDKHAATKEGPLHCKITEFEGKVRLSRPLDCLVLMILTMLQRYGDRSWKQIWAALKGPKLFLHKDKHHQVSAL